MIKYGIVYVPYCHNGKGFDPWCKSMGVKIERTSLNDIYKEQERWVHGNNYEVRENIEDKQ